MSLELCLWRKTRFQTLYWALSIPFVLTFTGGQLLRCLSLLACCPHGFRCDCQPLGQKNLQSCGVPFAMISLGDLTGWSHRVISLGYTAVRGVIVLCVSASRSWKSNWQHPQHDLNNAWWCKSNTSSNSNSIVWEGKLPILAWWIIHSWGCLMHRLKTRPHAPSP